MIKRIARSKLLARGTLAVVLLAGLVGGLWFGLHKWEDLRRPNVQQATINKPPKPKTPEQIAEAAREQTRRQVKPDRSNIDCTQMKCIALTYDDGPSKHTERILDSLKRRQAAATFFVLGTQATKHPATLKRTVRERSEIGNHTWNHPDLAHLNNASVTAQILQTDQAVHNAAGVTPRLIRPPYGSYNARVTQIAVRPLAMWSIDTKDWLYRDPEKIYQHVINHAQPGGIVVLHDIHPASVQATPKIIDELQRQRYTLVTMSELFGITDQNLPAFSHKILSKNP